MIGRFLISTLTREQFIERHERPASAALHCHSTPMCLAEKIFQRDEEIGAQTPLLPPDSIQISPLQQLKQKNLG